MSIEFPTLVYRCPGPHFGPRGSTYNCVGVANEDELVLRLIEGWCTTLDEAVDGKPVEPPAPVDNAPPTRAEMEEKARELKIKFDGRTTDRKLLSLIDAALKG